MSQEQNNLWPSLTQRTEWTRYDDKLFERALLAVPENSPQRWEKIAEQVPGKSPMDISNHYQALVHDVSLIDSGLVEPPNYADDVAAPAEGVWDSAYQIPSGSRPRSFETERWKETPWNEEEHMQFLMGLEKYSRGDWESISRNCVVTRTPTQVASHAQEYFLRLSLADNESSRVSTHDITTVDTEVVSPAIGQDDFLCQNLANKESTGASIHNIATVDANKISNAAATADADADADSAVEPTKP